MNDRASIPPSRADATERLARARRRREAQMAAWARELLRGGRSEVPPPPRTLRAA